MALPLAPVLVAEDDVALLALIRRALVDAGLEAIGCRRVRDAVAGLEFHRPAVAIVDPLMEGAAGWEVLRGGRRPGLALLVLDRADDQATRRAALAAGADEVIRPPFDPDEIAARVRALLRRELGDGRGSAVLRHHDLVVDVLAHEVRIAGRVVDLTAQQFAILRALCEARGATLHRSQLTARIAAVDAEPPSDRAVDLHVSRLRRRLGDSVSRPRYVEAVYGVGYRLARGRDADPGEEATMSAVLDALAEPVLLLDGELRIRAANRSARGLLGLRQDQLAGRFCDELLRCRSASGAVLAGPACLGRSVLSGDGAARNVRARIGNGEPIEVVFSHTRIDTHGESPLVALEIRPAG